MLHSPAPPVQGPLPPRSRSLPLPDRPRRLSDVLLHLRRGSIDFSSSSSPTAAVGAGSRNSRDAPGHHQHHNLRSSFSSTASTTAVRKTVAGSSVSSAVAGMGIPLTSSSTNNSGASMLASHLIPRRNSKSQVHAIDAAVYETLEQLLRQQQEQHRHHASSSRSVVGGGGGEGGEDEEEDDTLPAPPPLKPAPRLMTPPSNVEEHPASLAGDDDDATTEPSCFICLSKFTLKRPATPVPCLQCKDAAQVHLKCIYEWRTTNENGTCPLCRSALQAIHYTPPDPLCSAQLVMYSARKTFCTRPVASELGMMRCYVRVVAHSSALTRRTPTQYEMFLQAPTLRKYPGVVLPPSTREEALPGDRLLMTAARRRRRTSGGIDISLDGTYKDASRVLASVSARDWLGLDYTLKRAATVDDNNSKAAAVELANVRFEQNRVGSGQGPRRITVCLPGVQEDADALDPWPPRAAADGLLADDDEDDEEEDDQATADDAPPPALSYRTVEHKPLSKRESLSKQKDSNGMFVFARNRKPYYLESIAAFSLDFFGRVTLPSNKNFLLTCGDDEAPAQDDASSGDDTNHGNGGTKPESNLLVFGKVASKGMDGADADVYTLDFQHPLSPLQAFAIALASCDRKLGCA